MDYDLAVAIFRALIVIYVLRQFWNSILGGILTCIVIVSPIWIYVALIFFKAPFDLEMFRIVAAQTWELLFASPHSRIYAVYSFFQSQKEWWQALDAMFTAK